MISKKRTATLAKAMHDGRLVRYATDTKFIVFPTARKARNATKKLIKNGIHAEIFIGASK